MAIPPFTAEIPPTVAAVPPFTAGIPLVAIGVPPGSAVPMISPVMISHDYVRRARGEPDCTITKARSVFSREYAARGMISARDTEKREALKVPLEMRNAQIVGIVGEGQSARIVAPQMILGRVFPGKAEQVRDVRRWVREALPPCPARDDAEAIASELAANAVVHTASGRPGGKFVAYLAWSPERARIVIADGGAATGPVLVRHSAGERQRGLAVVDGLALTWAHVGGGDCRWTWADVAWNGAPPHVPAGGEADVADELRKLRAAYPGVLFWYGEFTGTWWTASGTILIDVPCPAALTAMAASLFAASRRSGRRPPDSRSPSAGPWPPGNNHPQPTQFRKAQSKEGG